VQDLEDDSDDDNNDITILRRQARRWADGGAHSEETDSLHATSRRATVQNNPAARSRSPVTQTRAEAPPTTPSFRHAQSQPQPDGSQVTRLRTRNPHIAQAVVQTSLISPSHVGISRGFQPSSRRSRTPSTTQSSRGPSPAPAPERIADAQDARALSPISNTLLQHVQEPLQPSQLQVWTASFISYLCTQILSQLNGALPVAIGRKRPHSRITQESGGEQADGTPPANGGRRTRRTITATDTQIENRPPPPPSPARSVPTLTPSPPKKQSQKGALKVTARRKKRK